MTKKDNILQAAIIEFAEHGFENVSMDSVAQKAKVAKGTIFYHFASKEDLFQAILKQGRDLFEQEIDKRINRLDDPILQIKSIINFEVFFIKKYKNFFRLYVNEFLKNNYKLPNIERVISNGKKTKVFNADVNSTLATTAIFWTTAIAVLNDQDRGLEEMLMNGLLK